LQLKNIARLGIKRYDIDKDVIQLYFDEVGLPAVCCCFGFVHVKCKKKLLQILTACVLFYTQQRLELLRKRFRFFKTFVCPSGILWSSDITAGLRGQGWWTP